MTFSLTTPRLSISPMTLKDDLFIQDLVNTPGWLKFIGNRNIDSIEQAQAYVQKILSNPIAQYWVVKDSEKVPVGIITFIKRDYLDHHDIGFAFLPNHGKKGYALEASEAVLQKLSMDHPTILASTLSENHRSINLLEKLNFKYEKEIFRDSAKLLIYRRTFPPK